MFENLWSSITEGIRAKIFSSIDPILNDISSGLLGAIKSIIEWVFSAYNDLVCDKAVSLLQMRPEEAFDGKGWEVISALNTTFVAIGSTLMIIFWLIGIFQDSIDIRLRLSVDSFLKQLFRLVMGEALVTYSVNLLQVFFSLPVKLMSRFSGDYHVAFESNALASLEDLHWGNIWNADGTAIVEESNTNLGWVLLLFLIGLFLFVAVLCTAFVILYTAFIRMFKVLIIIPYGALAMSTVSSTNSTFMGTTFSYLKYAFSSIMESVTMLIALYLGTYIISNSGLNLAGLGLGDSYGEAVGWMVQSIILFCVAAGAVKESGQITNRIFGS